MFEIRLKVDAPKYGLKEGDIITCESGGSDGYTFECAGEHDTTFCTIESNLASIRAYQLKVTEYFQHEGKNYNEGNIVTVVSHNRSTDIYTTSVFEGRKEIPGKFLKRIDYGVLNISGNLVYKGTASECSIYITKNKTNNDLRTVVLDDVEVLKIKLSRKEDDWSYLNMMMNSIESVNVVLRYFIDFDLPDTVEVPTSVLAITEREVRKHRGICMQAIAFFMIGKEYNLPSLGDNYKKAKEALEKNVKFMNYIKNLKVSNK